MTFNSPEEIPLQSSSSEQLPTKPSNPDPNLQTMITNHPPSRPSAVIYNNKQHNIFVQIGILIVLGVLLGFGYVYTYPTDEKSPNLIIDNIVEKYMTTGSTKPMSDSLLHFEKHLNTTLNLRGSTNPHDEPKHGLVIDFIDAKRLYQTEICNKSKLITISAVHLPKTAIITNLKPNCSENVKGLQMEGKVLKTDLLFYLETFSSIDSLTLTGTDICEEMEYFNFKYNPVEPILLPNLVYLKVQNVPECTELYEFLLSYVVTPSLLDLEIINAVVSKTNEHIMEKLVETNNKLQWFSYIRRVCDYCLSFTKSDAWSKIQLGNLTVTTNLD